MILGVLDKMKDIIKKIYFVGLNVMPKNIVLLVGIINRRMMLRYLGMKGDDYLIHDLVSCLIHNRVDKKND